MPKRKRKPPAVKMVEWFSHVASDRVDIVPNEQGEEVRVYSAPSGTPGLFLLLNYQRTPHGPVDVVSEVGLSGGPWSRIETNGPRRRFFYADNPRAIRCEDVLPRGQLLIHDPRQGVTVTTRTTDVFDFEKAEPVGDELAEHVLQRLYFDGGTHYVSMYQNTANGKSELRQVLEFRSGEYFRAFDFTEQTDAETRGA